MTGLDHAPRVQDALDALMTLPEYQQADTQIMVPVGAVDEPLGKLAVVHRRRTNGGARIADAYFEHGIGTVLYIHCAGDEVARLRESGGSGNLIVAGHISSDLIGINRYVAASVERGVEVVRMSGLSLTPQVPLPWEGRVDLYTGELLSARNSWLQTPHLPSQGRGRGVKSAPPALRSASAKNP